MRWRLAPGGQVLRRSTPDAAWRVVFEDAALDLTAGASPSSDVCWIATRQGDVLVTRDGRSWDRHHVAGPDDILAIPATDARAATVTLRSGLRLDTTDGGATWQPDR